MGTNIIQVAPWLNVVQSASLTLLDLLLLDLHLPYENHLKVVRTCTYISQASDYVISVISDSLREGRRVGWLPTLSIQHYLREVVARGLSPLRSKGEILLRMHYVAGHIEASSLCCLW